MPIARKLIKLSIAAAVIVLLIFLHDVVDGGSSRPLSSPRSSGEYLRDTSDWSSDTQNCSIPRLCASLDPATTPVSPDFRRGTPKPSGSTYSRMMVVPRLKNDNLSWISHELPGISAAIYVADDPTATLHPPRNKGHEVMVYLAYLIDHYHNLSDITIFMHAHQWTHHNLEVLGHDSAEMVRRLNGDYVTHEGYVNMRCQWYPGCPEWLHPNDARETMDKQEQVVLAKSWHELFPSEPLPAALGQACCAQFAVSKERILSIPLGRFVFYRDWMLRTPLTDYVSGRIWEYLWHFLFTGNHKHCPSEEVCHCQGFGVCFGGNAGYKKYQELRRLRDSVEFELEDRRKKSAMTDDFTIGEWGRDGSLGTKTTKPSRQTYLVSKIASLEEEIRARQVEAIRRGKATLELVR